MVFLPIIYHKNQYRELILVKTGIDLAHAPCTCLFAKWAGISDFHLTRRPNLPSYEKNGWKEPVICQVYPRSFKDSDGDGIGDLGGILRKLDYLRFLGADMLWLSPVYQSPNDDNGYGISDYYRIMGEFGTMADFEALREGTCQRGMKRMLDLVVNDPSDEHLWFQESRKTRDNP